MSPKLPVILAIGGHDPTGGAGIQADIETITSHDCHAVSLITCLTSQNTKEFMATDEVDPNVFAKQARSLLSDVRVDVVKIGAIGSLEIAKEISGLLSYLKNVVVIVDPVIKSSSGGTLVKKEALEVLKSLIFPKSLLITPNLEEAMALSRKENLDMVLEDLFSFNPQNILIKDIKLSKKSITNCLYSKRKLIKKWNNPKVQGNFHGTGCNLASSISCFVARSKNIKDSIELAQTYIYQSIKNSVEIGKGQRILKKRNEK